MRVPTAASACIEFLLEFTDFELAFHHESQQPLRLALSFYEKNERKNCQSWTWSLNSRFGLYWVFTALVWTTKTPTRKSSQQPLRLVLSFYQIEHRLPRETRFSPNSRFGLHWVFTCPAYCKGRDGRLGVSTAVSACIEFLPPTHRAKTMPALSRLNSRFGLHWVFTQNSPENVNGSGWRSQQPLGLVLSFYAKSGFQICLTANRVSTAALACIEFLPKRPLPKP